MHLILGSYVLVRNLVFMRHLISYFSMNLVISMPFSILTPPRYHNVTHFLTDPDEIYTVYVKLKIKNILFMVIFYFRNIYSENYDLLQKSRLFSSYPTPLPPSPLGRPFGWVLLWTHLSRT